MADFTNNQIKNTYQRVLQEHGGELQNGLGEPLTGSLSLSGSLNVTGSQTIGGTLSVTGNSSISGSLIVVGDVTARSVVTQLTQSTVLYQSGSTKFGDTLDDRHDFTGSLNSTGSLNVKGTFTHTGSLVHSGSLSVVSTGNVNLTGNIDQSGNNTIAGNILHTGSLIHSGTLDILSNGHIKLTGSISMTTPGSSSLVVGWRSRANEYNSVALGQDTNASGPESVALGFSTHASGSATLAIGGDTQAKGFRSFAQGYATIADTMNQAVLGTYNITGSGGIVVIGNGTSDSDRHNIFEAKQDQTYIYGGLASITSNPSTINDDSIIPASHNSRMFGPITIAAGKTLTVGANAKLEIIDI